MILNQMEETHPKLDNSVKIFERIIGASLPKIYRAFLEEVNGGIPIKKFFLYKTAADGSLLSHLFGITDDEYYDIVKSFREYRGTVPDDMIPIGEDQGGNVLLLAVRGPNYGKVYFLDHDCPLIEVADSFEEFINNLKSEEEMEALEKAQL